MRVAYLGNFTAPHCTEVHVALSLEALDHQVTRIQEGEVRAVDVLEAAAGSDLLLWTQTYGLAEMGGTVADRAAMLASLREAGIPTVGVHLDRWWGLDREPQVRDEPFFHVDWLFTADGGHDAEWRDAGVCHTWMPPAVYHAEAEQPGVFDKTLASDVAFVGSWQAYHPEWTHRMELVAHLKRRWHRRLTLWPRPGRPAIRGRALANLYASTKVAVGDSCLLNSPRCYWSDRIPETLGRGGFLLHPYVDGIESEYTDGVHLRLWPVGDWRELDRLITHYLEHDEERRQIAEAGRAHVLAHHTYRHRMQQVLTHVMGGPAAVDETPIEAGR